MNEIIQLHRSVSQKKCIYKVFYFMTNTISSRYYLFGPVIPRNFPANCSSLRYIYILTCELFHER